MVVIACRDDQFAPVQGTPHLFEERSGRSHRLAHRPVAQLEHIAQENDPVDPVQRRQQRLAQLCPAQQIGGRVGSQMQVGEEQRRHCRPQDVSIAAGLTAGG
jgi:hypothetical protein